MKIDLFSKHFYILSEWQSVWDDSVRHNPVMIHSGKGRKYDLHNEPHEPAYEITFLGAGMMCRPQRESANTSEFLKIGLDMWGQRSRAGTGSDARKITYGSHDAFLSVVTQKFTKWCQMQKKVCSHVKGQGQGKLLGPQFGIKCSSRHIRFFFP